MAPLAVWKLFVLDLTPDYIRHAKQLFILKNTTSVNGQQGFEQERQRERDRQTDRQTDRDRENPLSRLETL